MLRNYSASVYNNTVGTLRMIFDIAVEKGARAQNPARVITKKRVVPRELILPSPDQFARFVLAIEGARAWCSEECADLVRFLAYSGFRITEAANVTWKDCNFDQGQIRLRVTKNGKLRFVPMIPSMRELLKHIKLGRSQAQEDDRVMLVRECQKAMDSAARKVGIQRITHHDLRHLFATRCRKKLGDGDQSSAQVGRGENIAPPRLAYGIDETAAILGVSQKSVRRLICRGLIRPSRALRHLLISKKEIDRFLEETMAS